MKQLLAIGALFGVSIFASDSSALPPGHGGGGGGRGSCFTCDCSVTGTIGNKTCFCPPSAWGGIGCDIHYVPGWGHDCLPVYGPCKEPIGGIAP